MGKNAYLLPGLAVVGLAGCAEGLLTLVPGLAVAGLAGFAAGLLTLVPGLAVVGLAGGRGLTAGFGGGVGRA